MAKIVKNDNEVPSNDKVRKPTNVKTFSMNGYKEEIGAKDTPDKPLIWIKSDEALHEVSGMPGYPKGYVTSLCGYSNSGKSTAIALSVVNAQKMGILPIIIDLENSIGKYRLGMMGFDWNGNYISVDNKYLLNKFGKLKNKDKTEATIEDLAACIRFFLKDQEMGKLPVDLLFAIDSIGVLKSNQTLEANIDDKKQNNAWNALAYEDHFNNLMNDVIPNSRRIDSQYTNTVVMVNKIGFDFMNAAITMKGGRIWEYTPRLVYHFGGILTKGVKKITAVSKKREVSYGVIAKVEVLKNHIDGPLGGISLNGPIISTPHGFVVPDKLDEYKKNNILYFRNLFGDDINIADIENGEKIEETEGNFNYEDISNIAISE